MNLFQKMAAAKQDEIADLKKQLLDSTKLKLSEKSFAGAISGTSPKIIAEIKRADPKSGVLGVNLNLAQIVEAYNRSAAAISIVAEKQFFGGRIEDLTYAATYSTKPILVKDVILDKVQVDWYRLHGANAVLLNANLLSEQQLQDLSAHILSYKMDPFVEVHDLAEFETAIEIGAKIIAIHNVDPNTWNTDNNVTGNILKDVDEKELQKKIIVHASGVKSGDDLRRIKQLGYVKAVLIGTAFMSNPELIPQFKAILEE